MTNNHQFRQSSSIIFGYGESKKAQLNESLIGKSKSSLIGERQPLLGY